MSESLKELRDLSSEELTTRYDRLALHMDPGIKHYQTEIARRAQDKQTKTMIYCTFVIAGMTFLILVLTVANLVFIMKK